MARNAQTTIIKRIEENSHDGHHGGAWKVAYADFMTAMMAFFLLLWILSSSDEQKLKGIAEYFTDATKPGGPGLLDGASIGPPGILNATNGAVLARGTEIDSENQAHVAKWEVRDVSGDSVSSKSDGTTNELASEPQSLGASKETTESLIPQNSSMMVAENMHRADDENFARLEAELMQAMNEAPDLRPLKKNVLFEKTETGLLIQIVDQEGQPMFERGRTDMPVATEHLFGALGETLAKLNNHILISGHTDSVPFADGNTYDNWDLSTDRANHARRLLLKSGVVVDRLLAVSGKADIEPLVPTAPMDPTNRRISILLKYSDHQELAHVVEADEEVLRIEASPSTVNQFLDNDAFENLRSILR